MRFLIIAIIAAGVIFWIGLAEQGCEGTVVRGLYGPECIEEDKP